MLSGNPESGGPVRRKTQINEMRITLWMGDAARRDQQCIRVGGARGIDPRCDDVLSRREPRLGCRAVTAARHAPPTGRPNGRPMTGSGGASSTPRPFNSSADGSGILDHPPSRVMTVVRMRVRILAARSARSCALAMPSKTKRAQGKPGALSTRDRVHKMHTGDRKVRRNTRPSLRNGFTAYSALFPEPNSFGLRR